MEDSVGDPTIQQPGTQFTEQELTVDDAMMLQGMELEQSIMNITDREWGSTSPESYEEPALAGAQTLQEVPSAPPQPIPPRPIPPRPIPIRRNTVSGLYVGRGGAFELHLRIDVDRRAPLRKVSGDFYQVSGNTTTYFGSFIVDTITLNVTNTDVLIEGIGTYTWNAGAPKVRIVIRRTALFQPRGPARLQFFTTSNQPGAVYVCQFKSVYFRTVDFEQDWERGVAPFVSYNTGTLPSGGPARVLSVASAYGESGLEFRVSTAANETDNSGAGTDSKWSDAELHDAMIKHFSQWADVPQWKVWLFAAMDHEIGPGLYGIMFDQLGKQRQGCATFHRGIGGTTADKARLQLYTYVHELGHCFNLLHSWQKSFARPPQPNRPDSLSYMNYPWGYPDGPAAFWNRFGFSFDALELRHLRHGFRNNVVIGGNDFIVGSGLTSISDPQAYAAPVEDNSPLQLTLKATKETYQYGDAIEIEVKLSTNGSREIPVIADINPRYGFVQLGIHTPNGQINDYKPMMQYCIIPNITKLTPKRPALYESVYIGYSKMHGSVFDQSGEYYVRGIYNALDGSQVVSNILPIRITAPMGAKDQKVAELLTGNQQASLIHLLGSDSPVFSEGNRAFDQILESHADSPQTKYVEFVRGISTAKNFKTIDENGKVIVSRKANPKRSMILLSSVLNEKRLVLSPITINDVSRVLAVQKKLAGDEKGAKTTLDQMVSMVAKNVQNPMVLERVEEQADRALKIEDTRDAVATLFRKKFPR
jgi:hypothetical protein